MNANGHFEEDDLALYAMHLLAPHAASAMEQRLAESEEARLELGAMQARLAAYAESAVELQEVPEGSLERLMGRVAKERKILPMPAAVRATAPAAAEEEPEARRTSGLLPWVGWAVAAGMAIGAGKLYFDRSALNERVAEESGQVAHLSTDATEVSRQRDALTASLAERTKELEALRSEATNAKGETTLLRATTAGQAARLNEEVARLNDQAAKLNEQTARAESQATLAADASRERDALRGTLAAQASQLSQLSVDAAQARQVQEALNDPTALRVTLTTPKTSPVPTGRATYVANKGTLVFLASNMAPLEGNKVYELWLLPANGSSPVPAGTFKPDARGNANVVSVQMPQGQTAKGFAVTTENAGGAQTPTMPILLLGA